MNISMELLSQVIGEEVLKVYYVVDEDTKFKDDVFIIHTDNAVYTPSSHVLSNRCKEWAFNNGYSIHTHKRGDRHYRANPCKIGRGCSSIEINDATEQESTFKACEWVKDIIDKLHLAMPSDHEEKGL